MVFPPFDAESKSAKIQNSPQFYRKFSKFSDKQCAIPSCSEQIQMVPRTLCARGTIKMHDLSKSCRFRHTLVMLNEYRISS